MKLIVNQAYDNMGLHSTADYSLASADRRPNPENIIQAPRIVSSD